MNNKILAYTDGACKDNPNGVGGWAFMVVDKKLREPIIKVSGAQMPTTNNRMELTAILKCLQYFKEPKKITIISDSRYAINCTIEWIHAWKQRNWIKSDGSEVMNSDILEQIYPLVLFHEVSMHWVRGHSGDKCNEMVDEMAQNEIRSFKTSTSPEK